MLPAGSGERRNDSEKSQTSLLPWRTSRPLGQSASGNLLRLDAVHFHWSNALPKGRRAAASGLLGAPTYQTLHSITANRVHFKAKINAHTCQGNCPNEASEPPTIRLILVALFPHSAQTKSRLKHSLKAYSVCLRGSLMTGPQY